MRRLRGAGDGEGAEIGRRKTRWSAKTGGDARAQVGRGGGGMGGMGGKGGFEERQERKQ